MPAASPPGRRARHCPIVESRPRRHWRGGYAGLTLGYAFNGEDEVGIDQPSTAAAPAPGRSEAERRQCRSLRVGYRWQGNWVFARNWAMKAAIS